MTNKDFLKAVRGLGELGFSESEIAEKLNTTVVKLRIRKSSALKEEREKLREEVRKLREEGKSAKEIAEKLKISETYVYKLSEEIIFQRT